MRLFHDYNHKLAQLRAGRSSKSKLLLTKFKSADSLDGWEVRRGTYFQDVLATKYDGGMDAKFEFTEAGEAVFSGGSMSFVDESIFFPFFNTGAVVLPDSFLQAMFSPEGAMLNSPRSFNFHSIALLIGLSRFCPRVSGFPHN